MPPTRLTSVSNPRVKAVVRLRESRERRATGLFIAEGRREVTRAAAAGLRVREVYFSPELLGDGPGDEAWPVGGGRFEVTPEVFRKMAYVREPEGVLAVFERPTWDASVLPEAGEASLVLVAVGTEKPGNLGAMVRTAEAAGCAAVIAAGAPVDGFNPNAIRTSTGAVFTTPLLELGEAEAIGLLRERGYRLAAAIVGPGTVPHVAADFRGRVAIVIGPEDAGLSQRWAEAADVRVGIPMAGRSVDSLNASNAAAVLLFEAVRQRAAGR